MISLAYSDYPISILDALNVSVTGIVVVLIVLAILAVLVVLLSKGIRLVIKDTKPVKAPKKADESKKQPAPLAPLAAPAAVSALPDNQSAGSLDLYKTDEKTAAVIMAIVSNESGIPLNRLNFKSIKLIEE